MSFFQRAQPFLFSSLLALTASSCPPDRFLSYGRGEGDDGPLACPVRDLPPPGDGPDGVRRSLDVFAARGIGPETFHLENLDRLRPLTDFCSEPQIDRFDRLQSVISERISRMPPAEIASTLEGLYRQAYVYDETARTMGAGVSPAQQEAKRRLDLWIAAVDQRAFEDRIFLDRIWGEKRIRAVMALNSPHLASYDRGDLERMFRAEPGGDDALTRLFNERPMEVYVRQFDWLRSYDGRREKFFEDPFFRSQGEAYIVYESRFGLERLLRLGRVTFPREGVERLMEERGYGPAYRRFLGLSDETLIQNYHEVLMALTPQARPASRRRLVEDMTVMGIVFGERGLDPMRELERRGIEAMVRSGFSREDSELMYRLQTGVIQYTHDRLDDYRARHGLLAEYRTLYRGMLTLPLEEVFSPENLGRYTMWGNLVLNRSMLKVPVFLEDLDGVRRQVQDEVVPSMRFGSSDLGFEFRDRERPQWFTPSDLGLCHSLTGGPMVVAGLATFNGRTAEDLICSNVEFMAFLPESLHHEHALATALGVFGVITMRGMNVVSNGSRDHNEDWTPGALVNTLTHEAAHIDWFRTNFDFDSQRLPMAALNERRAYATGAGYLENYFQSGLSLPGEAAALNEKFRFIDELIAVTNETISIPEGETDPDYWEPHWDAEPPMRFAFQPPNVLQGRRSREMMDARFGAPTNEYLDRVWRLVFDRAVANLPPEDRRAAREGMERIASPSNTSGAAVYFLASDPFVRAVNDIRSALRIMPLTSIDASADDWRVAQRQTALFLVDLVNVESLRRSSPRPSPHRR